MFGWFKVAKVPQTPAEVRLEEIKNILFPPLELREGLDNGETFKYHVDYSADSNLGAALADIEDGFADKPVADTIKDVQLRLEAVRKALEAFEVLDKDAKYIIVDTKKVEFDPELIEMADE